MNAAQFFDHWNKVWRDLQRAIALLKDEHLDFRPSEHYVRSVGDILRHPRLNHQPEVRGGVMEAECGALLSDFFAGLRLGGTPGDCQGNS